MPRQARKISSTGIYHVMIRGVNKENIFKDDKDKKCFLRIMKYCLEKESCTLYAYCLMNNHVHLLIKHNDIKNISSFMRRLTGLYANVFNRKYDRVGHLFQERYKSLVVEDIRYFIKLIKYIHQNPEKAGIEKMNHYLWSSYREYIYGNKLIKREFVLKLLDKDEKIALNKLNSYLLDGKIVKLKEEKLKTKEEINEKIDEIIKGNPDIQSLQIAERIIKTENVNVNLLADLLKIEKTKLYRMK